MLSKPTLESVAQAVMEGLAARGIHDAVLNLEEREIVVKDKEGFRKLFLGGILHRCQKASPSKRQSVLNEFLAGMLEVPNFMELDDFEKLKATLMPVVRDMYLCQSPYYTAERADLDKVDDEGIRLTLRTYVSDIHYGLALDQPNTLALVTQRQLDTWGVTFEAAMEIALANLRAKSKVEAWKQVGPGIWQASWNDGYDSSRLLLPSYVAKLPIKRPVAIVPTPNSLLVTSMDNPQAVALMARHAKDHAEKNPRWVSFKLLRPQDKSWVEVDPPTAAQPTLRELSARHLLEAYGAQHDYLEKQLARKSDSTLVSNLRLMSNPEGDVHSMCVWNIDSQCLLPRGDYVAVSRMDGPHLLVAMLPWAEVMSLFGDYLTPENIVPVRYRTAETVPSAILEQHPEARRVPLSALANLG